MDIYIYTHTNKHTHVHIDTDRERHADNIVKEFWNVAIIMNNIYIKIKLLMQSVIYHCL